MVDVSVVTTGHDVADARLHRICSAFVRAGLSVEVSGLGDPADAPPDLARVVTKPRPAWSARALAAVTAPWRSRGRVLMVLDPELAPTAVMSQGIRRRPVVVDVHEDYPALLRDRPISPIVRVAATGLARMSTRFAARAALTVVADEHVPPLRARCRLVVRNLPVLHQLPAAGGPEPAASLRAPSLRALYVGDVRRSRGLQMMLEALEQAPQWSLDIVGPVAAADEHWLREWRSRSPAADRLRLHGRLPPVPAWSLAADASVGLALLDDTPAFRHAVPSKLYEYLAAGLAVAVTPLPRMVELADSSAAGAVAADATELAARLNHWGAHPDELVAARESARAWASRLLADPSPYDVLAATVAKLVKET